MGRPDQPRVPAGSPDGGQFAAAASKLLASVTPFSGAQKVFKPSRSPSFDPKAAFTATVAAVHAKLIATGHAAQEDNNRSEYVLSIRAAAIKEGGS